MTISRGQMNRQLYESGGIMSLSKEGIGGGDYRGIDMGSRTGFGILKKISRGVKKAVKGVSKIAKSDLGKAALIGAAAFGIPGTSIGGIFGRAGFGGAATGLFGQEGIAATLAAGKAKFFPKLATTPLVDADDVNLASMKALKKTGENVLTGNLGKIATLGAVTTFLTKTLGMPPEQAEAELARDPSTYLEQYYRNLNPPTADTNSEQYEAEVRDFVVRNTSEYAVGGRVGFAEGPVLPPDPTQPVNPFGPKPGDFGIEEDIPIKTASYGYNEAMADTYDSYLEMKKKGLIPPTMDFDEFLQEVVPEMSNKRIKETRGLAALGGKMDTASDNAMQAAGIEGLPVRQNKAGVKELDLRETGGFIQPVGIKEKEDDIPAMLSNNEFVMTADAVRGMGGGDVNLGAQRMYDQMKMLEAGGKV